MKPFLLLSMQQQHSWGLGNFLNLRVQGCNWIYFFYHHLVPAWPSSNITNTFVRTSSSSTNGTAKPQTLWQPHVLQPNWLWSEDSKEVAFLFFPSPQRQALTHLFRHHTLDLSRLENKPILLNKIFIIYSAWFQWSLCSFLLHTHTHTRARAQVRSRLSCISQSGYTGLRYVRYAMQMP